MQIKEPKIIFSNSQRAFREYAELYNEFHKNESSEQLKAAHFTQFYAYLRLLQRNIHQNNTRAINHGSPESMAIDTDNLPHLFTNNTELRKQLDGGVPSTLLRRFERLRKANIVRKINHGPMKNYEIIINPHLLFIIDATGEPGKNKIDLEKAQKWEPQELSDSSKIAKRKQNIVSFKEPFNKIIIHQKESANADKSLNEPQNEPCKESANADIFSNEPKKDTQKDTTGNLANFQGEKTKKDFGDAVIAVIKQKIEAKKTKNVPAAQKMREKLGIKPKKTENQAQTYAEKLEKREKEMKTLRLQYATMMVEMMIGYLLKGIKIFAGERNRTISYVAEHYFGNVETYVSIQRTWEGYAARLEDARRFKSTHPNYTPFPYYYFNKQNVTNGFESLKWRKNKNKWDEQKRYQTNQKKLMQAIRRINANPERSTKERELQYVKDNIPDMQKAFFAIIYQNHPELMTQKQ